MKTTIVSIVLSVIARTWRIRVDGDIPSGGVVAFWHGVMLPVWRLFAGRDAIALVSPSRDGEMLAALLMRWRYQLVRGSSSRDGKSALVQLIEYARSGKLILITPDGPRGPRGKAKRGAIVCAQHAQVPLYWCQVRCRWAWRFQRSWDRFMVPLPFASVEVSLSPAMTIPAALDDEGIARVCADVESRYAPTDQ